MSPGAVRRVIDHPSFVDVVDSPDRISNGRNASDVPSRFCLNKQAERLAERGHEGELAEDIDLMKASAAFDLEISGSTVLKFDAILGRVHE